jgi:hypothetical protein
MSYLFPSQDSADNMSENTSPEVVDIMEDDSKTPDSITRMMATLMWLPSLPKPPGYLSRRAPTK